MTLKNNNALESLKMPCYGMAIYPPTRVVERCK
jgi:hypothetical protein